VSKNTVAMRMVTLGLAGRPPRTRRSLTRQGRRPAAPDLVRRTFTAVAPEVLWCGDVTEIDTAEGKLYLATVEDLYSRRLLGYAMSEHHDAALTVASLRMAVATRGGDVDGVIFHSDRGSEYTAARHQAECARHGVVQSMGRVGCALDKRLSPYCASFPIGFASGLLLAGGGRAGLLAGPGVGRGPAVGTGRRSCRCTCGRRSVRLDAISRRSGR
jgi:hypothetical protein